MRSRSGRWLRLACGVGLLLAPTSSPANVGPPSSGGQLVAEPAGIQDIAIRRESLNIDLRPLAANHLAEVKAVYHLENQGADKNLELLFAAGSPGVTDFRAFIDDQPVASQPAPAAPLPATWQAPQETPGIHGDKSLGYLKYGTRPTVPIALAVLIPPGRHTFEVRYRAEAALHRYGWPTVYHQFAYILAPARSWAGFGGLDVTIQLPPGWHAASAPLLQREGDRLLGTFPQVPADAIALTVQAPVSSNYEFVREATFWLFSLTAVSVLVVCWRMGRRIGRSTARAAAESHPVRDWPWSLVAGVWAGLAVFAMGLLATFGPERLLPPGQVNDYGYGQLFAVIGVVYLSLILVPIGFAVSQITAGRTRRRIQASVAGPAK